MPKVWSGRIHFNTQWLRIFFFFQRKTSSKWRRGGRGSSLSLLFPGDESPSSSLNSGAHLRFHSVLSKTIYLMGSGASRQNRVEAISDSPTLSNPGHPTFTPVRWTERDRAPQIIRASERLSLSGSFPPHEVQPNTNYHIWSLFSKQGDGLVQRDPTDNNVDCKGAFREKKGRFSLCFNFLFCFFLVLFFLVFVFVFLRFGICLS